MSQRSKRAALSETIADLRSGTAEPVEHGPGPTASGIVGRALEVQAEAMAERLARLEAERTSGAEGGARLIEINPSFIDEPLPTDRDARAFSDEAFRELRDSIAAVGQHTPVIVRASAQAGRYDLAAGRRRVAACKALERPVLARVLRLNDEAMLALQYRENAERKDISAFERGRWLDAISRERGLGSPAIAKLLGVSQPLVVEYLKLGRLPQAIVEVLSDPRDLSIADARRLSGFLKGGEDRLNLLIQRLEKTVGVLATTVQLKRAIAAEPGTDESRTALQRRAIRDRHGRKLLTMTRSGNQWIFRWAPGFEDEAVEFVVSQLPELLERWRGRSNS